MKHAHKKALLVLGLLAGSAGIILVMGEPSAGVSWEGRAHEELQLDCVVAALQQAQGIAYRESRFEPERRSFYLYEGFRTIPAHTAVSFAVGGFDGGYTQLPVSGTRDTTFEINVSQFGHRADEEELDAREAALSRVYDVIQTQCGGFPQQSALKKTRR